MMLPPPHDAPFSRQEAHDLDIHLGPSLRNRLIAELALRDVDPPRYAPYLSEVTGRALQTVARWIAPNNPGLPDLKSLAVLCLQFDVDPGWMLGLSTQRLRLARDLLPAPIQARLQGGGPASFDWHTHITRQIDALEHYTAHRMRGHDMAPLIADGAPYFVDTRIDHISTNGIYALRYQGQVLVRHAEIRIGEGTLLRSEQPHGAEILFDTRTTNATGLTVLGRVALAINVVRF